MRPNEYQELADLIEDQLGRVQAETRALMESLRDEIRVLAAGVLANGRRLDEHAARWREAEAARAGPPA